jgi:phospholipid/cholesterol/gamma-HCH transport system permease protein
LSLFTEIGKILIFLRDIIRTAFKTPCDFKSLSTQIYLVTTQSILTTASAGFFVGAILSVQFSSQLKEFGALSVLGGLATSGTVRELGPLLIAFMLSGKIGAYTSAELATMRVTEQIDAIRCLGTDPMQYLIVPRFLGIIISSVFLLLAGLLMSILGGMCLGVVVGGMNPQEYLMAIPHYVTEVSIINGLVKCLSFSFLLATICTYYGFTTTGGAKGVGRAVVKTALTTMIGIVLLDWFTSYLARSVEIVVNG